MKKFLYYPNFEPPNTEWLKFSVLYFEKLESIVPYSRQHLISDDYRRLSNETDLVDMFSPSYDQGERASLNAIEESEKILTDTYRRSPIFHRINLRRDWRDQNNWNYQIYSEKFTQSLTEYCQENRIGQQNADGLLLPEELAFIFMTHLAKEISHERNNSIVTDNVKYDNYTNLSRVHDSRTNRRNKFAKGIINLLVPSNISELSFAELVTFRNDNRDRIRIFNEELDKLEDSIMRGLTEREFINSFNRIYSELTREIILTGLGIASVPFAAYMLINNPNALTAEYAKEVLGGLGIGLGGTYALTKAFFDTKNQRVCKKYLANFERLR